MNMIKVISCRFEQCLGMFTMLLVKGLLKRDFLGIYLNTFLESVILEIQPLWASSFFSKRSKFEMHFKNTAKNSEKVFCFWDNSIWISIVKLSLWRTRYFWSAANVLRTRSKISPVKKKEIFQLNFLGSDWRIW